MKKLIHIITKFENATNDNTFALDCYIVNDNEKKVTKLQRVLLGTEKQCKNEASLHAGIKLVKELPVGYSIAEPIYE